MSWAADNSKMRLRAAAERLSVNQWTVRWAGGPGLMPALATWLPTFTRREPASACRLTLTSSRAAYEYGARQPVPGIVPESLPEG